MAILNDTARTRIWAYAMRNSDFGSVPGVTKTDLRVVINTIDDWIDSAVASVPVTGFNAALPQPFRSAATTQQKTMLFCWVAMRRAGLLSTEEGD